MGEPLKEDTYLTLNEIPSDVIDLNEKEKYYLPLNAEIELGANKITVGNRVAVMAEFIGFEDALEKGMLVEEYLSSAAEEKISMQTDGNQFIITNDKKLSSTKDYAHHIFSGYAIVYEDGEFVRYTDGSISVAGVK